MTTLTVTPGSDELREGSSGVRSAGGRDGPGSGSAVPAWTRCRIGGVGGPAGVGDARWPAVIRFSSAGLDQLQAASETGGCGSAWTWRGGLAALGTPAATSCLRSGSSEHHRCVGLPDRGHCGTARWPPAAVERPGNPVTVRPDRGKRTRSLAHRADGHLRLIVGPGPEHVPAARVVHPSELGRHRAGTGRSPLRPSARVVHHSRSVPVRMQAEHCGCVKASASGRRGAPGALPA